MTVLVKLFILDVCGSPGCPGYAPICWQYVTKISSLDVLLDPRSAYVTNIMIPFQNGYFLHKALASATSALVFLSKIPKHKETWSKNSILIVTVALDSGPFRFAWGEGLTDEEISFESFKKWKTCCGLNFVYYCFQFSNVPNLLCWLMCIYSFVSSQVSRRCL